MRLINISILLVFGFLPAACQPGTPIPVTATNTSTLDLPEIHSPASTATPDTPTVEGTFTFTPTAAAPSRPDEAILIQEPASGSRVNSPIRLAGIADPTFEQTLVVRILRDDGTVVGQAPATIQADVGQRGPFEVEIPVALNTQVNIFIQVYAESARDGGVTHLSSTGVIFSPDGPEEILTRDPQPEQIAISAPQVGGTIGGGVAHIEGFALATFEQTLLIEIRDEEGNVVGAESVIVQASDPGQPGRYSADVAYTVTVSGPGRVVVRDPSPAFGGDTHLSSVEIILEP